MKIVLKEIIEKNRTEIFNKYENIFIDCPPSLSLLTVMSLVVADELLVPLQAEFFALEGLSQLIKTIDRVRKNLNSNLRIDGIVLTMYDQRNRLSSQVAQDVRTHLKEKVFETVIPRNVRMSEAPSFGLPALIYDHRSKGSQAYIQLANEILKKTKNLEAA